MKYGAHQNWCDGPGNCCCGQDSKEAGSRAMSRSIEQSRELHAQADEIERLKAQVRCWKCKAKVT